MYLLNKQRRLHSRVQYSTKHTHTEDVFQYIVHIDSCWCFILFVYRNDSEKMPMITNHTEHWTLNLTWKEVMWCEHVTRHQTNNKMKTKTKTEHVHSYTNFLLKTDCSYKIQKFKISYNNSQWKFVWILWTRQKTTHLTYQQFLCSLYSKKRIASHRIVFGIICSRFIFDFECESLLIESTKKKPIWDAAVGFSFRMMNLCTFAVELCGIRYV